jgi:hypothetical protein
VQAVQGHLSGADLRTLVADHLLDGTALMATISAQLQIVHVDALRSMASIVTELHAFVC